MKINTTSKSGFTLVEIMIVVAIIGLLAAIAIPNFVRARTTSQMNACINNLRQIDGAKEQYAMANNKGAGDTVDMAALVPTYIKSTPKCPAGTAAYTLGAIGTNPACAVDAANHVLP